MLKRVISFIKMKYQMWLMRQLDRQDLSWYYKELVDDAKFDLQMKINELELKTRQEIDALETQVFHQEELIWHLELNSQKEES